MVILGENFSFKMGKVMGKRPKVHPVKAKVHRVNFGAEFRKNETFC
jgi:hypothetical protein